MELIRDLCRENMCPLAWLAFVGMLYIFLVLASFMVFTFCLKGKKNYEKCIFAFIKLLRMAVSFRNISFLKSLMFLI